jgi:hypothetical protein
MSQGDLGRHISVSRTRSDPVGLDPLVTTPFDGDILMSSVSSIASPNELGRTRAMIQRSRSMHIRSKGSFLTVVVAGIAASTLIAGCTKSSDNTTAPATSAPTHVSPQALTADSMRSLLGTPKQLPVDASFYGPMTVKDAMAAHVFGPAETGITSDPASCLHSTDAIGDLNQLVGFVISGERSVMSAPNSLQRFFTNAVFDIPSGAAAVIPRLAKLLDTCKTGSVTIGTLKGTMAYKEVTAPTIGKASTFQSILTTTLPNPNNANATVACDATITVAADGPLLMWTVEPTPEIAQLTMTTMYDKALALK